MTTTTTTVPEAAAGDPLSAFHPVIQRWFRGRLGDATEPQIRGWPLVRAGRDVLIAAPTGSGKTLSAFLAAIDRLFRQALDGSLGDETSVLYVSPLKALGNDVQKNLLAAARGAADAMARAEGYSPQEPIRVHGAHRRHARPPSARRG